MKINASATVVKVTPELATEWLSDRWGEQRSIRSRHVDRLASDMAAGRFRVSPDAILRIKGKLANGQHRLTAVVQEGKPQQFLVMESNDEDLYKVIDAGLKRNAADGLIGITYAKEIPAVTRWVIMSQSGSSFSRPTQCEVIDYCIDNGAALTEAVTFTRPLYVQSKLLMLSIGAALHVLASQAGDECKAKCESFLEKVYTDVGDGSRTQANDLRNRLISNKGSKARLNSIYIFGLTVKAFKAYQNGQRSGVLRWASEEGFEIS